MAESVDPLESEDSTIVVSFDLQTHRIGIRFKTEKFRTWEFVVAALEMAKLEALRLARLTEMRAIQEAAHIQQMAPRIFKG